MSSIETYIFFSDSDQKTAYVLLLYVPIGQPNREIKMLNGLNGFYFFTGKGGNMNVGDF